MTTVSPRAVPAAPLIAPSILSADFANLAADIDRVTSIEQARGSEHLRGADWLHVDVMDNHFVPNLTIGLPVVKAIRNVTDIPLDCHLMIDDPDRWAPAYAEAGAANITFHAEAAHDAVATARAIRDAGATAGLSIKPGTALDEVADALPHVDTLLVMTVEPGFGGQAFMPEMMTKVGRARELVDAGTLNLTIEVDGGINAETIATAAQSGAHCFVAGSAIYGAPDPLEAIAALRDRAAAASPERG